MDDSIDVDHSGAPDEVVRARPAVSAHFHRKAAHPRTHVSEGSRMTRKPSELLLIAWTSHSIICKELTASGSTRSDEMASWFRGWECHARAMQGLAGCSAEKGKAESGHFQIWAHWEQLIFILIRT